jgi:hypothetical protein
LKDQFQDLSNVSYINIYTLELWTCDVNFDNLPLDPPEVKYSRKEVKLRRVKARMTRDRYR